MNVTARRKPKSRFARTPVTSADGTPRAVPPYRLTEQDIALLKVLARRRFLSADYIAALIGTSYKYALTRIQILKSAPNLYIRVCDAQRENPKLHLYTPLFYELDARGIGELQERGIDIPRRRPISNITHAIMVNQIMASFELGARDDIELILRGEILARSPKETQDDPHPDRLPITKDHWVRADGEMFVLKAPAGFYFFPGVEADTGTEPIHSYDYERSSIKGKFDDYIHVIVNNTQRTRFNAQTFNVAFITPTQRRLESMMRLLEEMTKSKPSLRRHFLFKTHPLFTSSTKPRPTGHMIDEEWLRVGLPPLAFRDAKGT
jgi:protein involved in plasmid replication-relaxation